MGITWDNYHTRIDWPRQKNEEPPEGVIRVLSGSEFSVFYWPIPPFHLTKDRAGWWLKWKDITLSGGDNVRMLVLKDPNTDFSSQTLDWSIRNFVNAPLWVKKLQREKKDRERHLLESRKEWDMEKENKMKEEMNGKKAEDEKKWPDSHKKRLPWL